MPTKILIVESPGKIAKIKSFLPSNCQVIASVGHIRDLKRDSQFRFGVDLDHDFAPIYQISPDKTDVVKKMKQICLGSTNKKIIYLAADADREGEAIAESCRDVLNLTSGQYHRIIFHEITQAAVTNAMQHPKEIDTQMVDAQIARRVLDRLVGFSLSPLLRKLEQLQPILLASKNFNLGTGRVQSVIVKLAVEREKQIKEEIVQSQTFQSVFHTKASFQLTSQLENSLPYRLKAVLVKNTTSQRKNTPYEVNDSQSATHLISDILNCSWKLNNLPELSSTYSEPSPPFITSTLGSEAHSKLGYTMKQTMSIAQKLYERGLITYMRTDSPALSQTALQACQEYITTTYGMDQHHLRQFRAKVANAQEAHEAIRPVQISRIEITGTAVEQSLYRLIWKQTVASQMVKAEYLDIKIQLQPKWRQVHLPSLIMLDLEQFRFVGELKFLTRAGYLLVMQPNLEVHSIEPLQNRFKSLKLLFALEECQAKSTLPHLTSRYNEATLIKQLEKMEIGRPATYASLLNRVKEHQYVTVIDSPGMNIETTEITGKYDLDGKSIIECNNQIQKVGAEKNRLIPTQLGEITTQFLITHFPLITDDEFTKNMERDLDHIAEGLKSRTEILTNFWTPFQTLVSQFQTTLQRMPVSHQNTPNGIDLRYWKPVFTEPIEFQQEKYLVYSGQSKKGDCLRICPINSHAKQKNHIFLNHPTEQLNPATVINQLKQKLQGESVGQYQLQHDSFGSFVQVNGKKYRLSAEASPTESNISQQIQQQDESIIQSFEEGAYQIRKGQYGPYILIKTTSLATENNVSSQSNSASTSKRVQQFARKASKPKFVSIDSTLHDKLTTLTLEEVKDIVKKSSESQQTKSTRRTFTKKIK